MRIAVLCFAIVIQVGFAQPILPAYRSPGGLINGSSNWWVNVGVPGGIPAVTTVYKTMYPTNTAADISSACQACPSNQVVFLSAGTYFLNDHITWHNNGSTGNGVVLRGAGMTNTILIFTNTAYIQAPIEVDGPNRYGNGYPDDAVTNNVVCGVYGGYSQGSSNLSLFVIGTNANILPSLFIDEVVTMDQSNDVPVNALGWDGSYAISSGELRMSAGRAQQQAFRIKAISNLTNITVWPPVYLTNWQASLRPNLWWEGVKTKMCGIESLTISATNYFVAGASNSLNTAMIFFWGTDSCWVTNVHLFNERYGVLLENAKDTTVSGCYFDTFIFLGRGASGDYGFVSQASWDSLVENNAFNYVSSPILPECSAGAVFAYNFVTNDIYVSTNSGRFGACAQPHQVYNNTMLFEGNWGTSFTADFTHGSQGYLTALRNRLTGFELPAQNTYLYPVNINASNWWVNILGNVLGTAGKQTTYQFDTLHLGAGNTVGAIYTLGFLGDTYTPSGNTGGDTNVAYTILQHGNYDVVTSTNSGIVWDTNTPNHTIPASYYAASKPSYFSLGYPYPPFEATTPTSASPTNLPAFNVYANASLGGGGGGAGGAPPANGTYPWGWSQIGWMHN